MQKLSALLLYIIKISEALMKTSDILICNYRDLANQPCWENGTAELFHNHS